MKEPKKEHQEKLATQRKYNHIESQRSDKAMKWLKEKPYSLKNK